MNEFKEIREAFKQEWSVCDNSHYLQWHDGLNNYYIDEENYLYLSKGLSDYEKIDHAFLTQEEAMMAAYMMETWVNE